MKKLIFPIFIIFFITVTNLFSYNWELVKDTFIKLFEHSVYVDSMTFGVYGPAGNSVPKFYLTNDGGSTWQQTLKDNECFLEPEIRGGIMIPQALTKTLSNSFFLICDGGYIIQSTDSGKNWFRFKSDSDSNFIALDMYNDSIGIAATKYTLHITDNGCKSFQKISINYPNDIVPYISDIKILDSESIIILAYSYSLSGLAVFITKDRGKNWTRNHLGLVGDGSIANIGTKKIWIATRKVEIFEGKYEYYDLIFYSSDGGDYWTKQMEEHNAEQSNIRKIQFSDELNGIATGWDGLIYMTFDGGNKWERFIHNDKPGIIDNFDTGLRNSPTTAFVFSKYGLIYKYDKNITSVSKITDNSEILIFPNPAYGFIDIQLPEDYENAEKVNFQIYNMYGEEVLSEAVQQIAGSRIDISHLPAGLYFVKIIGSNGACPIVEKFIKI